MVFPTIFLNMETGTLAQFTTFFIIFFSYCLHRWKKLVFILGILLSMIIGIRSANAFMAIGGACGTMCMAQRQYNGAPYGGTPQYFYPQVYPSYLGNNNWQFPTSSYYPPDCVACRMQGQSYNYYQSPYAQPQWMNYGMTNYSNFNYPGSWGWGGTNGANYPGHGHGFAGKPNIYFSGKAGTEIKIKLKFSPGNNLLAAVPALNDLVQSFKLTPNNELMLNGVEYGYLFYDYRMALDTFQFAKGFCTDRAQLISKLESVLVELKFLKKEIADFTNYWTVKMPASEKYCVYPQLEKEINGSVALEVSPQPTKITRVIFFVLPQEMMESSKIEKISIGPSALWGPSAVTGSVVSTNELELREWGVAFLNSL